MNRPGHENTNFFVGTEVEHSPAFGLKTLFVVGIQRVDAIKERLLENSGYFYSEKDVKHIYFGANQSFPKHIQTNDAELWHDWESMIRLFLDQGYWCTLDLDISAVEGLCESGLVEYNNFIPMISAKIPYIQLLGYNATLKIDDKDFKASNPGVWCHNLHQLQSREVFTDWSKYTKDEVIK